MSASPDPEARFEVAVSTDKDQVDWNQLEFKGDSFPKILVRERATGKLLAAIQYSCDANSDARPIRENMKATWTPKGDRVALTVSERFYSHVIVFVIRDAPRGGIACKEVKLPAFPIEAVIPGFKEFRPRSHESVMGWTNEGHLRISRSVSADTLPGESGQVVYSAVYSFIYDLSHPRNPILISMNRDSQS
ncbi:hypothetical protein [Luteolibacter rhizosphaerae]|uniref:hypothetical protein n=1 Tax=Luteolibacter rhizosphaerae TaxID=2989719 RepID=UPI002222311B|nr:hypothetical protein [Luteolibacter rhizosphaerae]